MLCTLCPNSIIIHSEFTSLEQFSKHHTKSHGFQWEFPMTHHVPMLVACFDLRHGCALPHYHVGDVIILHFIMWMPCCCQSTVSVDISMVTVSLCALHLQQFSSSLLIHFGRFYGSHLISLICPCVLMNDEIAGGKGYWDSMLGMSSLFTLVNLAAWCAE